jgi:hypothetical protein
MEYVKTPTLLYMTLMIGIPMVFSIRIGIKYV